METFGLGLVVSFDDKASEGLKNVTQSYLGLLEALNQNSGQLNNAVTSQVGLNLSQTGDTLISMGKKCTDVFKGIVNNVKSTGQEFENFKITLGAIYKDESIVEEKLRQLFDFSIKSPFEVSDTKDMLIVLKSIGVDAFQELKSASTGFAQEGLSWITDLMAFKPDVPVTRWKLALTNFLGSGEAKVLRNILDSGNIADIIGREVSDTAEGRMQDLMDIATNLGMEGLTDKMSGTLETKLSNLGDFFTKFYYKIADAGAFDQFKRLLSNMTSFLIDDTIMTEERIDGFAKSISEALAFILTPIERLTEKFKTLSVAVMDFVAKHPNILKVGLVIVTVTGSALILLGVITKLGGALTSFLASLKYLNGGASIFSMLRTGLWNILKVFGPLSAAAYLLYRVWDLNLGGIQEKTRTTIGKITDTVGLIWDAFQDNTLSEENFEKAKNLGILPLIEAILQLKYHWGFFVEGFKKGFDAFVKGLSNVLVKLGILDVDVSSLGDLFVALVEKITAPGMTDTWEKIGYFIGEAFGYIVLIVAVLPVVLKIIGAIAGAIKWISALVGTLKGGVMLAKGAKGYSAVGNAILGIGKAFVWLKNLVVGFDLGSKFAKLGSIIARIGPVFSKIGSVAFTVLKTIGTAIWGVLGAIGALVGLPAWAVGLIIAAIGGLIAVVVVFWDEIKGFFVGIGQAIGEFFSGVWEKISQNPVVQSIIGIFSTIFNTVKNVVMNIIEIVCAVGSTIWNILKGIFDVIKTVVMGAWQIIQSIVGLIGNIIYAIYEVIRTIVLAIILVVQNIWDAICTGLEFVYNIFATVFGWIYDNIIKPIVDAISDAWNWLSENVFEPVGETISDIFKGIKEAVDKVGEKFSTVFGGIKTFVINVFEKIDSVVSPIIDGIRSGIQWIVDGISSVIDGIGGFFGGIGDFFKGTGDKLSSMVGLSTGGYVSTEGIAVLHPNEVVVNDHVTRGLESFLSDYNNAKFTSSPLVTQSIIATDDYEERDNPNIIVTSPPPPSDDPTSLGSGPQNSPINTFVSKSVFNHNEETHKTSENDNSSQDNSVVFEKGSVVIQVTSNGPMTEDELYAMSDKLMQIMSRKMQLRNLQTRR